MLAIKPIAVVARLALICVLVACRTGGADDAELSGDPGSQSGYFVSVAANSVSSDVVALYDELHDALDRFNRKVAQADGTLDAYLADFEADGYTSLVVDEHEIECDREKCLIKLPEGRITAGDAKSFAGQLTAAFAESRVKPLQRDDQKPLTRTWFVGKRPDMFLSCAQKGTGSAATFACEFDLERGLAEPATQARQTTVPRGKLVSCDESPGTVRSAEDAKAEIYGSDLLNLTQGPQAESKPVGFLRYVRQNGQVEFEDIYLCGDVSHDFFVIDGSARNPRGWLPKQIRKGASLGNVSELAQDEATMQVSAVVVDDAPEQVTLQVKFKIAGAGGAAAAVETYGDDGFFVRIDKRWVQ
jgi:hypothetical protein